MSQWPAMSVEGHQETQTGATLMGRRRSLVTSRTAVGGAVWYLDCELAEGYADISPAPVREPKVLPKLGSGIMVKGTQAAH